jgi:hypothetical protein
VTNPTPYPAQPGAARSADHASTERSDAGGLGRPATATEMTEARATTLPFTRSNLRGQIKDVLLQRLVEGSYPPGSRIVETRVAQELGVPPRRGRPDARRPHAGRTRGQPARHGGERAGPNAELVEKAIRLAPLLDRSPADPDGARAILGL